MGRTIAFGRKGQLRVLPDQGGAGGGQDEGAVGQILRLCRVAALFKAARDGAGGVQLVIEQLDAAAVAGGVEKGAIGGPAAFPAGPVTRRQGHGLVMKEQLGIAVRGHQGATAVLEFGQTADPGLVPPAGGGQAAMVIMQHTAIAHKAATGRVGEDLSCGLDTVLQRHGESVAGIVVWGKGWGTCVWTLVSVLRQNKTVWIGCFSGIGFEIAEKIWKIL